MSLLRWSLIGMVCGAAAACNDDTLSSASGSIRVTVVNAGAAAQAVRVQARGADQPKDVEAPVALPETVVLLEELRQGSWEVRVATVDAMGLPLRVVWISDALVLDGKVTEIRVDLADAPPASPEICDGLDNDGDGRVDEPLDTPLCAACQNGFETALPDDERCGVIDCDGLDRVELRGANTVESADKQCVRVDFADITTARCVARGRCLAPNGERCGSAESVLASAGVCRTIRACESGAPEVVIAPDDTPCGTDRVCKAGVCTARTTPPAGNPEGCADRTREGFVSVASYPAIAGCAGGWSVPGLTRAGLAPTCGRASGNSGTNTEGTGCAAADLCAEGWHVCLGKDEVAARAPGGCGDAVPAGAPDRSLFFAVAQASQNNTLCAASGDNDVFGCGNLGTALTAERGCAPLTRALASTQADRCGFNEAEPPLGPWECHGGTDSHLHEGALVTKSACRGATCTEGGRPITTWEKGGVLCCRD